MDLTRFMHGPAEPLIVCAACGTALRVERFEAAYESDVYDPQLLAHLYPRYCAAFRAKESNYRNLLPARAEVVEVGSHIGGFLNVAEEWNWRATGLDIGGDSSAFARGQGLTVRRTPLEDSPVRSHSTDAVFFWNCFEQLPDPGAALKAARGALRPFGLVVLRVPNFEFYERARNLVKDVHALACNNLLGFPYLNGYTPRSLISLARNYDLEPIAGFNSTLLTLPFPDLTPRIQNELERANHPWENKRVRDPASLDAPWIEVVFRARPE